MSDYAELNCTSKQRIVSDLKNVVADAEEILRATADVAGEKVADLRERITLRLQDARARLADAETIVVDKTKAAACIARGLSVLQGDLNEEVDDFPDCSFDYVILSQTLQQVFEPARLLYSLARIGRKVIVSFPNFSHYSIRLQLLLKGIAPKNDQLPYSWYDSPNIRVITLKDFKKFTRDVGYNILREIASSSNPVGSDGRIIRAFINFRAAYGIYIIEKIRSE